ncbi:hypothetical protein BJ138DRAFT_1159704 [Hygrophoropsis aurantiaca]|uniref:Uncharacterized protein n=1 Tax=Hygrophoropsis aurantiaca TaxID=72124 RepID=A0ACB8A3L6_9AGAM|nr:hypothetical protein BJ138DRAFT_1159704 [Hygrophoropsis aurantiaca]
MSQSIQQLQVTEFSNYWTLATAAAVLYDQALNFGQEIDFIWNRKWSVTTILYFIARYSGSLSIGANAAWINIYLVTNWTTNIFVLAMQAILLIRAYALCGQSKIVLALLLTCYLSLALAVWILTGLCYNLPTMKNFLLYLSPAVGNIEQLSYVNPTVDGNFLQDITIFFISFDILVLLIALYGFITHVLEARRTHGGWSVNNLIRILTADQVLYFLCFVGWMILSFAIMVDSVSNTHSLHGHKQPVPISLV